MRVSKAMYCFSNYHKIWKRICIKRWEGRFFWKGTWKLTALLPYTCDMGDKPGGLHVAQRYYDNFVVLGVRRRVATVPLEWLSTPRYDVDCIDYDEVSLEQFVERYDKGNKPCIIRNAMRDWPAFQNLSLIHI